MLASTAISKLEKVGIRIANDTFTRTYHIGNHEITVNFSDDLGQIGPNITSGPRIVDILRLNTRVVPGYDFSDRLAVFY